MLLLKTIRINEGQCLLVEKSRLPTIDQDFIQAGIPTYIFACSENELPDETKSNSCALFYPIKKSNCFSRSLSESEKMLSYDIYNFDKCCYRSFNDFEECVPMDSTKIEELKEEFINSLRSYGYELETSVEIICGDSANNTKEDSNNSTKDSSNLNENPSESFVKNLKTNNKLIYIIWLIIILF